MINQENREIAIQLSGVKKKYKLGQIGGGSLQADLQSWWARIRGKEDPNSIIGTDQRLYGQTFMALNGIDLTVYKGEALGIIGGNGAGKSTLLKILSRVTAPTEGEIDIYGRIASMLEVGTGFSGEMTGRENVYMNGTILGMTKEEIDAKIEQIIDFSEVRDFIDTPVKRYSSGMYVKLAFSVAAHLDSEIMIMDEVLAVGDMAFQNKCLTKMKNVANQEGRTVLYVSHNMNTIRQLCDRCIVLDKGKVVFVGDVEKAIGVYMNSDKSYDAHVDFSEIKRSKKEIGKVKMLSLDVLNKDENIFKRGENIDFVLHCKVNDKASEVGLRFEIFGSNAQIAGTTFLEQMLETSKGRFLDLNLSLKTNNFSIGRYRVAALLFEKDRYGNQTVIDRVEPALSFKINYSDEDNIVWLHQHWGYTRFDDMQVKKLEIKD